MGHECVYRCGVQVWCAWHDKGWGGEGSGSFLNICICMCMQGVLGYDTYICIRIIMDNLVTLVLRGGGGDYCVFICCTVTIS